MNAHPASPRNAIGAPTSPRTALTWRAVCRRAAFSGVVAASIRCERDVERAVVVGVAEERQHVVVEDGLAFALVRNVVSKPGAA